MTVKGVGSGAGATGPLPQGAAQAAATAAAEQAETSAPGAQGDSVATQSVGSASLIGADGKVRMGWGLVDAPEVKPTDPGKLIAMKRYGDTEMPEPRPDIEGPPVKTAELPSKPEEPKHTPIRNNKFSITTGPPQGDP